MDKDNMYIIGIDFGNGETSAAVLVYPEKIKGDNKDISESGKKGIKTIREKMKDSFRSLEDLNIFNDKPVIKSSIYKDPNSKDPDNPTWYLDGDIEDVHYLLSNSKSHEDDEFGVYFKGPLVKGTGGENGNNLKKIDSIDEENFGNFVSVVLDNILSNYRILDKEKKNFKLYVACPSQWEKAQKDEYKRFLIKNGLPVEDVIEESRAAYVSFKKDTIIGSILEAKNNILVIDYGSSTIDFTWYGDVNQDPVHDGCDEGARKVEEFLFDEMEETQEVAKIGFSKFVEALGGSEKDKDKAKLVMIYALREMKENLYRKKKKPNAFLQEIPILNLISLYDPKTGEELMSSEYKFGFDKGVHWNTQDVRTILKKRGYLDRVKKAFERFRDKEKVGVIENVILTGGASEMDFVIDLVEEVFKVSKEAGTLQKDQNPSTSISRGIAKFGLYHYLSEPIKKEIDATLNSTWLDEKWLKVKLKELIPQAVHSVYYDKLNEIIKEWAAPNQHTIVSSVNHNLDNLLRPIITTEQFGIHGDIWTCVKNATPLKDGQRSLHAFLRVVYDYVQVNDKFKEISMLLNQKILEEVNNQVGVLLNRYVDIYFDRNDKDVKIKTEIPSLTSISIEIPSREQQVKLLKLLVESAFKKVKECDRTTSYTIKTFNKDREAELGFHATREDIIPALESVVKVFSDSIEVNYSKDAPIEKICKDCKASILKKYKEIEKQCNLSEYRMEW